MRSPELLLLDEPTVGVDPLSRRELWDIVQQLVREQGLTVLIEHSYLDEAESAARVLVLHEGKVLAQASRPSVTRIAAGHCFVARSGRGRQRPQPSGEAARRPRGHRRRAGRRAREVGPRRRRRRIRARPSPVTA